MKNGLIRKLEQLESTKILMQGKISQFVSNFEYYYKEINKLDAQIELLKELIEWA